MKLKNLSKILAFGILLNNIPLNSFAGVLSEDTRYETFTDNDISIPNILEEDKVDVKIDGNTLINIYPNKGEWISDTPEIAFNRGNILVDNSLWKENTIYTVKLVGSNVNKITHMFFEGISNQPLINGSTFITSKKTEWRSSFLHIYGSNFTTNDFNDLKVMVFEGDLTSSLPIDYFEGLQSSFEDSLVTQEMVDSGKEKIENLGKYKIEYKATGKNTMNINYRRTPWAGAVMTLEKSEILLTGNKDGIASLHGTTDMQPIHYKKGTILSYSMLHNKGDFESGHLYASLRTYYINNTYKDYLIYASPTNKNPSIQITLPEDIKGISILYSAYEMHGLEEDLIYNLQLEENISPTEYEPYKESINTFYLNSPLLEGDTIEYINGQATHVHRYRQVEFNGSDDEGWFLNPDWSEYNSLLSIKRSVLNIPKSADIICNIFKLERFFDKSKDMTYSVYAGNLNFNIILEKNTTLEEWLLYLKSNPLKVVYELEDIIYEPIKANLAVNLFEGTTHILNNSTIPATMEVTVDRVLNRAVEFTELVKVTPTINNLSKARYWNNLLKDSIKKDQLQEEVNSITKLNDMVLDKKIASSNLDLYIKSENILMMSLSTNNITFEDFSGIEDMTKENAVQISINSSLPYSLDAYLPTEIQNSDKSVTMNKDILNIKENSETTYQTFSNTTDKIVLKDNCSSGNNLIHGIDIKLKGGIAHEKDIYKTTIKFEAEQK